MNLYLTLWGGFVIGLAVGLRIEGRLPESLWGFTGLCIVIFILWFTGDLLLKPKEKKDGV